MSNKIKGNNETSKIFIGYMADIDVVTHLYVLFYHKLVVILNISMLETKICHLKLKMIVFTLNIIRFGIKSKNC